jgi:2-oxoglutarate dehydrogenase E2 component (dihydrolipoamide succinyltransferase)
VPPPQGGFERVKLTPMRQSVSAGVMQAVNGQAMTPNAIEINMENLIAVRDSFKAQDEAYAASVSYQSFFIKALALAARDVPITNARMGDGYIDIFNDVNVAFAVAIDDSHAAFSGLVMPVIHQADKKGILEIQQELTQLVARARERRLSADDMQDGTITLSSTAGMVADYMISTPLLNQGQSYIGQPGNIVDRPVVRNGELTVGKIMTFCFTFDHRVMDGVPACQAASRFKEYIENPSLMLR